METDYRSGLEGEALLHRVTEALSSVLDEGYLCRARLGGTRLPSQAAVSELIATCRKLLFPGFFGASGINAFNVPHLMGIEVERLQQLLSQQTAAVLALNELCEGSDSAVRERADFITARFLERLPSLRQVLQTDVEALYYGDPAAQSFEEVIYCYPGIKAITNQRIAHELLLSGVPILPRMITEAAHSETGIDIHPGATIGHHFAIDHGTGVVIGSTCVIGDYVKIYQGVTLGAHSFPVDNDGHPVKGLPRHPVLGNNVVVYSNATILGRVTIGDGAVIGSNIWVTGDVAPGERIVQARPEHHPAR